eukprot:GFKZ01012679.1.p1 GENE.GFKZ01012679.1~~GFKZ01012679.1.p1  ORF type:complete len:887 (-),score=100.77 GFKZ01012679.1:971-3631(-)
MSAYVGKLFTAVSSALEFNTATLSGAIDIVVVEDDAGRRSCSPFHVRFGKLQLLKSRGIPVQIELNGQRTPLRMLLGAAGEAYFYNPKQKTTDDDHLDSISPSASVPGRLEINDELAIPVRSATVPTRGAESFFGAGTKHLDHVSKETSTDTIPSVQSHVVETTATDYPFGYISDSEVELTRNERAGTTEVADEPRSPPLFPSRRKWSATVAQNPPVAQMNSRSNPDKVHDDDLPSDKKEMKNIQESEPMSSGDDQNSALFGLPSPGHCLVDSSDYTTADQERARKPDNSDVFLDIGNGGEPLSVPKSMNDVVGEEETKLDCRSVDGYEADEDNHEDMQDLQDQVALVLARPRSLTYQNRDGVPEDSDKTADAVPGVQTDRKQLTDDGIVAMSLCGSLIGADMDEDRIMELFERHKVTYEEFSSNPNLLNDPSLLFRIDDRLVELKVAAPFIFSVLAFNMRMDMDMLARITAPELKEEPPKSPPTPSRRFGWFSWASAPVVGEPLLGQEDLDALESSRHADEISGKISSEAKKAGLHDQAPNQGDMKLIEEDSKVMTVESEHSKAIDSVVSSDRQLDNRSVGEPLEDSHSDPKSEDSQASAKTAPQEESLISFSELDPECLSLRPTSEELNALDLKPGANSVRFFVEASSVELNCRIFLWSCHTKIVISDVDGTITRSDVLGHLLPAVGRDWSQVGVAGLYTQIEKNGYKTLYLTARPIGQASQTRAFLHNVTQGSAKLPNGPVLMSPNRLVESFTREVIRRKPQEFKIGALREVRSLFSPEYNPFHAGFGNRETDVISYRAVGLIPQRIFVVNPKGELVVMKAKYESTASYSSLQDLVESVFPDISGQDGFAKIKAMTESATYNDWNYWKGSLPEIDLDELLGSK